MTCPYRVTTNDVKQIIDTAPDVDNLEPFIEPAHQLVNEFCLNKGYSELRLREIERWLAAHFYSVNDPRTASESAGGISVSYHKGQVGEQLKSSNYGQHALLLDTAGGLAQLSKKMEAGSPSASVKWAGK